MGNIAGSKASNGVDLEKGKAETKPMIEMGGRVKVDGWIKGWRSGWARMQDRSEG